MPSDLHIYIAGPYTKGDTARNIRVMLDAAQWVVDIGAHPFVPLLSHFWEMVHPNPYEVWMRWCLSWVRRCDAVLRLPGESSGADREVALAEELGIPVFTDRAALAKWVFTNGGEVADAENAWADLNRRAAAVPGFDPQLGERLADGRIVCDLNDDGSIFTAFGDRDRRAPMGPDMGSAGTRGFRRAALGSPALSYEHHPEIGTWKCGLMLHGRGVHDFVGYGSSLEEAEAAALVALAEARQQWGPG